MIIKKAGGKRPLSEKPNRSVSARDLSIITRAESTKEQLLRLQPIKDTDSINLLGLRENDRKRYIMPHQIVLNEHIYSDDKNIDTGKPRVLISNHSRRTITLPRIIYCDEGYNTHKYNVLHSINKWANSRKGNLISAVDSNRQKLLTRPSPILICSKKFPGFCKELTDSSGPEISTTVTRSKHIYSRQNGTCDKDIQNEIPSTIHDTNFIKRPKMSPNSLIKQTKTARMHSNFSPQSKQPLFTPNNQPSQHIHKIIEKHEEEHTERISSYHRHEQDILDRPLEKPPTLTEHENHQLPKQLMQIDNQDIDHESVFQGIQPPDYYKSNASQTESSWTNASQQNVLVIPKYRLPSQVKSTDDIDSQSNPTQSETIYGNILSFERRLLPESGNDSFAILPLHYCASDDTVLQSSGDSESTRLSSISIPLLSTDMTTEQSTDTPTHQIKQSINERLSCDTPISPMASRIPTALPSLKHTNYRRNEVQHGCVSPPFPVQPSVPPSKLISSNYDLFSPSKEKPKHRVNSPLLHIIDFNSALVQCNTGVRDCSSKRFTTRSLSAFRSQIQMQSKTNYTVSRLQERGAQNFYRKPDPIKLAGLIVHSLIAIEPIFSQNTAYIRPIDSPTLPAPLAPISSEVNHATSLPDVQGSSVPQKRESSINVGISRYPLQLHAFIEKSTSITKPILQRQRTRTAPSTSGTQTTSFPRLCCYKLRSASARIPVTRVEPLFSDLISFRPHTAPALSPLSPCSPTDIKLLYNTPMTIGKENIIKSIKGVSSPHTMRGIRIFPEDLSDNQLINSHIEYHTPHVPLKLTQSIYAPMKVPTTEEQISMMCDVVSARNNALTDEDIEEMKQIFYNTSHDSASSPYAQHLVTPNQQNYVTRLFKGIRKDAYIRQTYGIDKIKRGLNMELYKRIKHSEGDAVIHKIRGVQPDTDSSSPDGFEPPDFRVLVNETNSPQNLSAATNRNLKTVKAFLYTPSSSHLEDSPSTDCPKKEQDSTSNKVIGETDSGKAIVKTPIHNPVISILNKSLTVDPNKLTSAPSQHLRRCMTTNTSLSHSGMIIDSIAYLHTYTPNLHVPPYKYRIAKSTPLNITPRDSKLTKILKEELNKHNHASFRISHPMSHTRSFSFSSKPATCSTLVKTALTIDDCGSQIILDDQETATAHDCLIQLADVLRETRRSIDKVKDEEMVSEVPDNGKDALDEDQHVYQNSDTVSSDSTPLVIYTENEPNNDESTVKNVTYAPSEHVIDPPEKQPPNLSLEKHNAYSHRRAIPGDKTVSNRKACRRFYKEAIIDRDIGRIYRTYTKVTPQPRLCTTTQLSYEKLLSRPLTVSKEKVTEKAGFYQAETRRINQVIPSFGTHISYLH